VSGDVKLLQEFVLAIIMLRLHAVAMVLFRDDQENDIPVATLGNW
jgi:hypothetical protein